MIRLTELSLAEKEFTAVKEVLASGQLVQGHRVKEFENSVALYLGCKHAVAVSNCTAALHLALLSIDIRPGDLVLVTSYSWPATANAIELCGAQPVFVDIILDDFNIDPHCMETTLKRLMSSKITARRVKGIMPVHAFGKMSNMPEIMRLADYYELPVIEDAACALGATLLNRQAGTWGLLGCFSFHPRKTITTGEGGIVTTNDPALSRHIKALRNHGQDPDAKTPDFILPGFNYRMTEFQAVLGTNQMEKLDHIIAARRRAAEIYNQLLKSSPLRTPLELKGSNSVFQSYVILLPESLSSDRDIIIESLRKSGIESTIGTWNIPMTSYFRRRYGYQKVDFPISDQAFARSITLPLFEGITRSQQERVVKSLVGIISKRTEHR